MAFVQLKQTRTLLTGHADDAHSLLVVTQSLAALPSRFVHSCTSLKQLGLGLNLHNANSIQY